MGIMSGAFARGTRDTFEQLLAQRMMAEEMRQRAQQQDFENRLKTRQLDQADELTRLRLQEQADARNAAAGQRAFDVAKDVDEAMPAGPVDPSNPAVGLLQMVGAVEAQPSLASRQTSGFLRTQGGAPGVGSLQTQAAPSQFMKRPTAMQQSRAVDDARMQAALSRQETMDAETRRHNRAMETKPPSESGVVQVMGPNGVPIYMRPSQAVGQPAAQAPRAVTGAERQTLGYFNRMLEAERNARRAEEKISGTDLAAQQYAPGFLENWLQSAEGQAYTQAQRMYTEARLRKESGAAIPMSEFETDRKMNFRIAGDKPGSLSQKRRSRVQTLRGIGNAAGRALNEFYGEGTTLDSLLKEFEDQDGGGMVPMMAPDGRSLMVPAEKVQELEAAGAKRR